MFKRVIISLSTVVIWCAACTPLSSTPAPVNTTISATPLVVGRTPDIAETSNPTPTIRSGTATVTVSSATPSPRPGLSVIDHWLQMTQSVDQLIAITKPRIDQSYVSPDKRWRIDIVVRDCTKVDPRPNADENSLMQLVLVDVQNSSEAVILDQFIYCGGLGAYGFGGLRWSADSHAFYFTPANTGGPDGMCWYWERPIYQLDIQSREVVPLGGGPTSPDGASLAVWQADELVIWDYARGEVFRERALVDGAFVGPKAWSPDSQKLVYIQNTANCMPSGESSLVMVDVVSGAQRELLRSAEPSYAFVNWVEPDQLVLGDFEGERWRLTLSSGNIEPEP